MRLVLLLLAACRIESVDPVPDASSAVARCQTPPGGFAVANAYEVQAFQHASGYSLIAPLEESVQSDVLAIHLFDHVGVFAAGWPVSFPAIVNLSGPESIYSRCGACVLLFTDVAGTPSGNPYVAKGGTLTIESVEPYLRLRLSNLTLERVAIDGTTYPFVDPVSKQATSPRPDASGCTTTIDTLQIDAISQEL